MTYITRFKAHTSPLALGKYLVGKDASLTQSPPTLPLAFVPLTSPHVATYSTPLH
jgi:hypothetical protein